MTRITAEIAVLGSGFAGSLAALILSRQGREVVLIDKATHPRFAIGESSTPSANMVLRELSRRYDLPRLAPLARYGSWCSIYPGLGRGLKRGFSYFQHEAGRAFAPRDDHANELLVAASGDNRHSDTHWLRADVDAFLASEAAAAGVPLFEDTWLRELANQDGRWTLAGSRSGETFRADVEFVIDATGEAGVVPRALGVPADHERLATRSRAVFSHFYGVRPWHELLADQGGRTGDHPFCCDDAAQHHVLDGGWLWLLRFDNGLTSAGLVLDERRHPLDEQVSPEREWQTWLQRYPSLAAMFASARLAERPGRLLRTARMQRRWRRIAGDNWVALPNTAGFIDPLHSTGIAHSLCGMERLARVFDEHWQRPSFASRLDDYQQHVHRELDLIDQLVAACYRGMGDFPLLVASSMLYFAAATTWERLRFEGRGAGSFLCADDPAWRDVVRQVDVDLHAQPNSDSAKLLEHVASAIQAYNHVGLCDRAVCNMYRYTAAASEG